MKIKILSLCIVYLMLVILTSCEDRKSIAFINREKEETNRVLILADSEGMAGQTAQYIGAFLSEMGYGSEIASKAKDEGYTAVVCVGDDKEYKGKLPTVRCLLSESRDTGENTVAPFLSSKSLARSAVLLLPDACKFSVISEIEGAADVQDACDFLDLSGIDYTVETLDGRAYGDAVYSAAKKGCDVLLLISGDSGGAGFDLSDYKTAVIAMGEGEPVKGALGSFCIDTEKLAAAAAEMCVSVIEGKDTVPEAKSYYSFCISGEIAERFNVDIEAVSEDFSVVLVE